MLANAETKKWLREEGVPEYQLKDHAPPTPGSSYDGWQKRIAEGRKAVQGKATWFILSTEPQMERKAVAHLVGRRFKAYVPQESVVVTRGVRRRKVNILRPMFRGYVFIKLDAEGWDRYGVIVAVPGVHKFLRIEDRMAFVPDDVMERVFNIAEVLEKPKAIKGPSAIFAEGETVRVTEGPFIGFTADIERLDDDERITILIPFLGRASRIQIAAEDLEKL